MNSFKCFLICLFAVFIMLATVSCNNGEQDGAAVTTEAGENAPTNAPTREETDAPVTDVHIGNGEDYTWETYYPFS